MKDRIDADPDNATIWPLRLKAAPRVSNAPLFFLHHPVHGASASID
ncbi:hypothetical protein ACQKRQ_26700 [Paraburkholderia sp. NPDC080076]